jgi:protein-S-isoprenylcysteine O-methyltransferase Ste14
MTEENTKTPKSETTQPLGQEVETNQTRMRDSRILAFACFAIFFFTGPIAQKGTGLYEFIEFLGYICVIFTAIGRVYTTGFLGGNKNKNLITGGPFSIVRNPLYSLSLLGTLGVGFLSMRLGLILLAPIGTAYIYHNLVKREEANLTNIFGAPYTEYLTKVPRFVPNFKLWNVPETAEFVPYRLTLSLYDALWWVLAVPIFGVLKHFFH